MKMIRMNIQVAGQYISVDVPENTAKDALLEVVAKKFSEMINVRSSEVVTTTIACQWQEY